MMNAVFHGRHFQLHVRYSMNLQHHRFALAAAGLFFVGCSSGELPGGPRFETFPVTGTIHIDGTPADLVEVECHPLPESTAIKYPISAMTDKDGVFTLTTYGLPEGTYTLAFK
jgi:hypothetical protein